MSPAESPDVLTGGRWVLQRGVLRWVDDPQALPVAPVEVLESELDLPRCGQCERKTARQLKRGMCRACYERKRYRERQPPPVVRACLWCQTAFETHDSRQTHCTPACARERYEATNRPARIQAKRQHRRARRAA